MFECSTFLCSLIKKSQKDGFGVGGRRQLFFKYIFVVGLELRSVLEVCIGEKTVFSMFFY